MKVSVVIVSHNMCKVLCKSLRALTESVKNLDAEIILVDNGSDDKTVTTIMKEFPFVRITSTNHTTIFSKAANQGVNIARGEYILLLNPDAIAKRDTISKVLEFMDMHTEAAGLGVRMVDQLGNYLPESKKVLPKAWVAFFKLTGLAKQFPKSRLTQHLNVALREHEFETTEADVLSSKFMMIRSAALKVTGLFDERFTRYGAGIDLSYRFRLAGLKNYYFPKTYIIDLKEVDIPSFSWAHLKSFYGAMFIFAVKYFFRLPALHVKPLQDVYTAYELKG